LFQPIFLNLYLALDELAVIILFFWGKLNFGKSLRRWDWSRSAIPSASSGQAWRDKNRGWKPLLPRSKSL